MIRPHYMMLLLGLAVSSVTTVQDCPPPAEEVCDGVDNDGDGEIDEGCEVCDGLDSDGDGEIDEGFDVDADGYLDAALCPVEVGGLDCDDHNPDIHPGATEVLNQQDDDCNGVVDDCTPYYPDADGDGYGDPSETLWACRQPPGYLTDNTDCDDSDPLYHPMAPEDVDDHNDYNCDGDVSFLLPVRDGVADLTLHSPLTGTFVFSVEPNAVSAEAASRYAVSGREGLEIEITVSDSDILDDDEAYRAFALEHAILGPAVEFQPPLEFDPVAHVTYSFDNSSTLDKPDAQTWVGVYKLDQNEDGTVQASESPLEQLGFDADGGNITVAMTGFSSYIVAGANAKLVFEPVYEAADEDSTGKKEVKAETGEAFSRLWRFEVGGWPIGGNEESIGLIPYCTYDGPDANQACVLSQSVGWDSGQRKYVVWLEIAGAEDIGDIEHLEALTYFADPDQAQYFDEVILPDSCTADARDFAVNAIAGADRISCSPQLDSDAQCIDFDGDGYPDPFDCLQVDICVTRTFYRDQDSDGFGDPDLEVSVEACLQPEGYVVNPEDCDDSNPGVYPEAKEACDTVDSDCDDSLVDDFEDSDGDGLPDCIDPDDDNDGDPDASDCARLEPTVYHGAAELCDGLDNDCNSALQPSEIDQDGDGFVPCSIDNGGWDNPQNPKLGDDCNDADAFTFPGAAEHELELACTKDADLDGHGDLYPGPGVTPGTDCNDQDGTRYPGATELCDGLDNDCNNALLPSEIDQDGDGFVPCAIDAGGWDGETTVVGGDDCDDADPFFSPATLWTRDNDGDGFGDKDQADTKQQCMQPNGYLLDHSDCDDSNDQINPSKSEETCNGVDDNCFNDLEDDHPDADEDTYDVCPVGVFGADGWKADCNDSNASIYPGADELCDGVDNDCNGEVDPPEDLWYEDADEDNYGNPNVSIQHCAQPDGYVRNNDDCDDTRFDINPGQIELCNDLVDNDCRPSSDEACWLTGPLELATDERVLARFLGESNADQAGFTLASAGDFNGDGHADFAIGTPYAASGCGRVYLFFGPLALSTTPSGPSDFALQDAPLIFEGECADNGFHDQAGYALAEVGDLNDDGYSDLLIGAPGHDPDGTSSGAAYLVLGGPDFQPGVQQVYSLSGADVKLTGTSSWGFFGHAVSRAGDLNGDGWPDLAIGAPEHGLQESARPGAVHLLYGPFDSQGAASRALLEGPDHGALFGYSISGGVDFLGDETPGRADLLIGAPGLPGGGSARGALYLVAGGGPESFQSWDVVQAEATLAGETDGDRAGYAALLMETYRDIEEETPLAAAAIGIELEDSGGTDSGAVYLYAPPPDQGEHRLSGDDAAKRTGAAEGGLGGRYLATGDLNHDGFADLIVGAPGQADTNSGATYIFYAPVGTELGSLGEADVVLNGATPGDATGCAAVVLGDVTGNGYPDLLVGACQASSGGMTKSGLVYLVEGQGI